MGLSVEMVICTFEIHDLLYTLLRERGERNRQLSLAYSLSHIISAVTDYSA